MLSGEDDRSPLTPPQLADHAQHKMPSIDETTLLEQHRVKRRRPSAGSRHYD
jgi:hypothetical protein